MAENKTAPTDASVEDFLDAVPNERRREDAREVVGMMAAASSHPPTMWGPTIIGFGQYHYAYDSGREGDSFRVGVAPRKRELVVYIMGGFDRYEALLERLGKHKTGKSCLYIRRLDAIDRDVLRELIDASLAHMAEQYPE